MIIRITILRPLGQRPLRTRIRAALAAFRQPTEVLYHQLDVTVPAAGTDWHVSNHFAYPIYIDGGDGGGGRWWLDGYELSPLIRMWGA